MHEVALSGQSVSLIMGIAPAVVGLAAIVFAWCNTRATLKQQRVMASDDRKWQEQRIAYQKVAEWLASNHILGAGNPFYEQNKFAAWTSDPGNELEATARLFATEPVIKALACLRDKAITENALARAVELALSGTVSVDRPFSNHEISKTFGWTSPGDASRELTRLREAWNNARNDLEKALRDAYRPV
jgi:hypothetical protein